MLGLIFLLGGGLDFTSTIVNHTPQNPIILNEYPKATATSPAAMFFYILGFMGLLMLYWGGKDFHQDENLAKKRLFAAMVLLAVSTVGQELLLRVALNAI